MEAELEDSEAEEEELVRKGSGSVITAFVLFTPSTNPARVPAPTTPGRIVRSRTRP